jgi:hypothetical protein
MEPWKFVLALTLAAFLLALSAPPASACSIADYRHVLDETEQELDSTPPGVVEVLDVEVHRGRGPDCEGLGGYSATSCDDIGWISITVVPPADDRTPADEMGYRLSIVEGDLAGIICRDLDVRAQDGVLHLHWIDGDTDDQEPVDFQVVLQAIDLGGNLGPASAPVDVRHPGSGGCRTAVHNSVEAWLCLLAIALAALRRTGRSS